MSCAHTTEYDDRSWTTPDPDSTDACTDCTAIGSTVWAHLRMCLDVRARRLLRLQPAPPRQRPPRRDRAPGDALVRAGRGPGAGATRTCASSDQSGRSRPSRRRGRRRRCPGGRRTARPRPLRGKRRTRRGRRPGRRRAGPRRRSVGRKTFSSRNVKACTASPAACASSTSGPGAPSVPSAMRGITRFLWTPTASAYPAIAARLLGCHEVRRVVVDEVHQRHRQLRAQLLQARGVEGLDEHRCARAGRGRRRAARRPARVRAERRGRRSIRDSSSRGRHRSTGPAPGTAGRAGRGSRRTSARGSARRSACCRVAAPAAARRAQGAQLGER